jgi:hypothetical protein
VIPIEQFAAAILCGREWVPCTVVGLAGDDDCPRLILLFEDDRGMTTAMRVRDVRRARAHAMGIGGGLGQLSKPIRPCIPLAPHFAGICNSEYGGCYRVAPRVDCRRPIAMPSRAGVALGLRAQLLKEIGEERINRYQGGSSETGPVHQLGGSSAM